RPRRTRHRRPSSQPPSQLSSPPRLRLMRLLRTTLLFASLVIGGSLRAAEPIEQDALHDDVVPAAAVATSSAARVERTSVTIDWSRVGAETSRRHFSINASLGARPPSSAHPGYQAGMAYM